MDFCSVVVIGIRAPEEDVDMGVGVDVGLGVGAGRGEIHNQQEGQEDFRRLSTPHCGVFGTQGSTGCGGSRPVPSIPPLASD